MKPIIGITVECKHKPDDDRTHGQFQLNWNYAEMVAEAGGVPLVIPPMADMKAVAPLIDGWLIPGGDDIDAARFGEENHPKVELQDPARYESEAALWKEISAEMPVLGICYGCQFLNVIRGGSLVQHLPDVVNHEAHSGGTMQGYCLNPESKTAHILGTSTPEGRSYHHQAVGKLGEGLQAVGSHEDGTVEALEATDRPWMIGVQWHPERTPQNDDTRNLFRSFIQAAADFNARKGAQ